MNAAEKPFRPDGGFFLNASFSFTLSRSFSRGVTAGRPASKTASTLPTN